MSLQFYTAKTSVSQRPFFTIPVPAGNAANVDQITEWINIDDYVRAGSDNMSFIRVTGDSMEDVGIHDGDLLAVRRTDCARIGNVVIAEVNGEFTVKRLTESPSGLYLVPANGNYAERKITKRDSFGVWAVVTHVIHKF